MRYPIWPARRRCAAAFVSVLFVSVAFAADDPKPDAKPVELHFAADNPFDMQHIRLELAVDVEHERVEAAATLTMAPRTAAASVVLDAVDFDVLAVQGAVGDGETKPLVYANDGRSIEVFFGRPLDAGTPVAIEIDYTIDDPADGLHFYAPTDDDPKAPYQVWSQGESITNRYWIPCFDNPNEMQTTELIVTVDDKYQALSNGRLVATEPAGPGKTMFHWSQEQPHSVYLVTLVVGQFAVEQETWRGKPVLYYVPPDKADEVKTTFQNTTKMLDFFSDALGVEYPWPKYAQVCCYQFGGGMENTSATTLGEGALHDARSAIDGDSDGLISHEMAHQWFGDYVTCNEWAHLWLNEGFASYFEALWDEHNNGPDAFAMNMAGKARGAIRGGKEHPIIYRGYDDPDEQFDSRAYPKGAWVVHMLRRRLGDEMFWRVLKTYLNEHAHTTVETSDLRKVVEEISGRSFERFFYDWTQRAGAPSVEVKLDWDEDSSMAEVHVTQTQDDEAFHFPLTLELTTADAETPIAVRRMMTTKEETFLVPLPSPPTMLEVDPDQWVLMDLKETKGRDLWVNQLSGARSAVDRVRAAKELAKKKTDANRRVLADAFATEKYWQVRSDIAEQLGKIGGDAARDALIEGAKSDEPKIRSACVKALSNFADDDAVQEVLAKILNDGDESMRVESAAIASYAETDADDAVERVRPFLAQESRRDVLRSAAIDALGKHGGADEVGELIAFTKPEYESSTRSSAIGALGDVASRAELEPDAYNAVVEALSACLDNGPHWVRIGAVRNLGDLGEHATAALPALQTLVDKDADSRLGKAAQKAIDSINDGAPSDEKITKLRDELQELREENKKLRERLDTLEAKNAALSELSTTAE